MRTLIVDAFTDTPFKGNPAGVCFPEAQLPPATMRSVAAELNLSETAFVREISTEHAYSIRYFSPKAEIPLCGHATVAAAMAVFETRGVGKATFVTAAGIELQVREEDGRLLMALPVFATRPDSPPGALLRALGIEQVRNAVFNEETRILLLEMGDAQQVRELTPDFAALLRSHDAIAGVLITAPSDLRDYDFISRYFWPWSGTNEDPVTGGVQTFLAPYWAERLGKKRMKCFQASARTGTMEVELTGERVLVRGRAVIVLDGRITV